jgi:iron-only hydrogenase group A
LRDPNKTVVVQHAPSISVTIAEEFGLKPGTDAAGAMVTALRMMGFDAIFDTSFTADLTVMEEASELVDRVKKGGTLPLMTSCSPGWVKFVETFYPHRIDNLSTCKSPQQMLGAITKTYYAEQRGLDPHDIFSVSIMPCTAKKFEVGRGSMGREGVADVDAVLTTRELARMIKLHGIDLGELQPSSADNPFGQRSSAGKLFGASGGVAEAALRTGYKLLTGEELPIKAIKELRGFEGVKEFHVEVAGIQLGVAVVSGLGNARKLLDEIDQGRSDIHFIEVMTCPGGCINGGGQPLKVDQKALKARLKVLYDIDRDDQLRTAHDNPYIKDLYEKFLGEPLGHKSHHLLHTTYQKREVLM